MTHTALMPPVGEASKHLTSVNEFVSPQLTGKNAQNLSSVYLLRFDKFFKENDDQLC